MGGERKPVLISGEAVEAVFDERRRMDEELRRNPFGIPPRRARDSNSSVASLESSTESPEPIPVLPSANHQVETPSISEPHIPPVQSKPEPKPSVREEDIKIVTGLESAYDSVFRDQQPPAPVTTETGVPTPFGSALPVRSLASLQSHGRVAGSFSPVSTGRSSPPSQSKEGAGMEQFDEPTWRLIVEWRRVGSVNESDLVSVIPAGAQGALRRYFRDYEVEVIPSANNLPVPTGTSVVALRSEAARSSVSGRGRNIVALPVAAAAPSLPNANSRNNLSAHYTAADIARSALTRKNLRKGLKLTKWLASGAVLAGLSLGAFSLSHELTKDACESNGIACIPAKEFAKPASDNFRGIIDVLKWADDLDRREKVKT